MKRSTILPLLSVFLISLSVKAQTTDSLHYGLGRTLIRKDITQAITIKGEDLEKMPYNTLTETIKAWLYGLYGTTTSYVTNVNGMVMVNADALSIYDIDQITVMQNTATTFNGASPNQVMLLITTKKNTSDKFSINAAGQTNRVSSNQSDLHTGNGRHSLYHQYYLSAYTNTKNISAGISAGYQRYVSLPLDYSSSNISQGNPAYNRYRFNGYLQAGLGKSILNVNAGYAPQNVDVYTAYSAFSQYLKTTTANSNSHILYGTVSLNSSLGGSLHNVFNAGINHLSSKDEYEVLASYYNSSLANSTTNERFVEKYNTYVLNDNLSAAFKSGGWLFEPSVNIEYRHLKDSTDALTSVHANGDSVSHNSTTVRANGALATPSIAISYRHILNLQGGVEMIVTNSNKKTFSYKQKTFYPFALMSLNMSNATGMDTLAADWRLYGSYARTATFMQNTSAYVPGANGHPTFTDAFGHVSNIRIIPFNPYATFDQWQIGTDLAILKRKLTFSYSFTGRKYLTPVTFISYINPSITYASEIYTNADLQIHRFGIGLALAGANGFSWRGNFNVSYIKSDIKDLPNDYPSGIPTGLIASDHEVTGGFANRFNYKHLTFGADLLYAFHATTNGVIALLPTNHSNYFSINNMYIGYQFNAWKIKHLEVFANGNNLINNKKYYNISSLSFYGLGFRASI